MEDIKTEWRRLRGDVQQCVTYTQSAPRMLWLEI